MADNPDIILRNSLDAVDRGRRWAILGIVALFVATAISIAGLFGRAAVRFSDAQPGIQILKILFVSTSTQMLFVACCTAVVMFHVTRTTKAVLRALDILQSRRAESPDSAS